MDIYENRRQNLRQFVNDELKGNSTELARRVNRSPSYIHRLLNNPDDEHHKNLGEGLAREFEGALNLPSGWLDVPFGATEKETVSHYREVNRQSTIEGHPVIAWADPNDLDEEFILIDRYDLKFAAGNGHIQWDVHEKQPLAFTKDFLKRKCADPKMSKCMYVKDSSMYPYLSDGDIMLVDTSCTLPLKNGEVYAIRYGEEYRVKRIKVNFDGSIVLRSDNPDKTNYPDEPVTVEEMENIYIIGMVKWRAG